MNHSGRIVRQAEPAPFGKQKGKLCHPQRKHVGVLTQSCSRERRRLFLVKDTSSKEGGGLWGGSKDGSHPTKRPLAPSSSRSSLSSSWCTNSYFHLHDCINYTLTLVSRLQPCVPQRKQRVETLTKQYIYSADTSLIKVKKSAWPDAYRAKSPTDVLYSL